MGDLLCVSPQAISTYEKGRSDPGVVTLAKLAEIGEVTLDELILGRNVNSRSAKVPVARECTQQGHDQAQMNNLDLFILDAIKAADSETVGAVMNLLMKRKSKPEGSMKNGTEG